MNTIPYREISKDTITDIGMHAKHKAKTKVPGIGCALKRPFKSAEKKTFSPKSRYANADTGSKGRPRRISHEFLKVKQVGGYES